MTCSCCPARTSSARVASRTCRRLQVCRAQDLPVVELLPAACPAPNRSSARWQRQRSWLADGAQSGERPALCAMQSPSLPSVYFDAVARPVQRGRSPTGRPSFDRLGFSSFRQRITRCCSAGRSGSRADLSNGRRHNVLRLGKGQRLGRAGHQAPCASRLAGLEGTYLVAREPCPEHARRLLPQLSGDGDELARGNSNSLHVRTFIECNFSLTVYPMLATD